MKFIKKLAFILTITASIAALSPEAEKQMLIEQQITLIADYAWQVAMKITNETCKLKKLFYEHSDNIIEQIYVITDTDQIIQITSDEIPHEIHDQFADISDQLNKLIK